MGVNHSQKGLTHVGSIACPDLSDVVVLANDKLKPFSHIPPCFVVRPQVQTLLVAKHHGAKEFP